MQCDMGRIGWTEVDSVFRIRAQARLYDSLEEHMARHRVVSPASTLFERL